MQKPRVLFLNLWEVYPPKTGGEHSVMGLIQAVADYCECTLAIAAPNLSSPVLQKIGQTITHARLPAKDYTHHPLSRIISPRFFFNDTPLKLSLRIPYSKSLRRELHQLISNHDAVVLCHPWMWPAVRDIPEIKNKPVFYDAHNVEANLINMGKFGIFPSWMRSFSAKKIEADLCKRATEIWCCTESDAHFFQSWFEKAINTRIGFKGRSAPQIPLSHFQDRTPSIVFVGSNWHPNNLAAKYIASNLAEQLPEFDFHIIGACSEAITTHPSNVFVRGYVDDLDKEIMRHRLAINPVTTGSGINIKMMDYLATGTPTITTKFGARGFPDHAFPNRCISDIQGFPQTIRSLMNDSDDWERISHTGRQVFEENFSWKSIGRLAYESISRSLRIPSTGAESRQTSRCSPPTE